jgi:hypothetical protein
MEKENYPYKLTGDKNAIWYYVAIKMKYQVSKIWNEWQQLIKNTI